MADGQPRETTFLHKEAIKPLLNELLSRLRQRGMGFRELSEKAGLIEEEKNRGTIPRRILLEQKIAQPGYDAVTKMAIVLGLTPDQAATKAGIFNGELPEDVGLADEDRRLLKKVQELRDAAPERVPAVTANLVALLDSEIRQARLKGLHPQPTVALGAVISTAPPHSLPTPSPTTQKRNEAKRGIGERGERPIVPLP